MEHLATIFVFLLIVSMGVLVSVKPDALPSGMRSLMRVAERSLEPYRPMEMQQAMQEQQLSAEAKAIQTALGEIKTELNTALNTRFDELKNGLKVPDIDPKITGLETQYTSLKAQLDEIETKARRQGIFDEERQERKSAGQQFIDDMKAKEYKREGGHVNFGMELKALTTADASAGLMVEDVRLPLWEGPTEPHIRDLIPSGQTSGNTLKFPRRKLSSDVRNAAMVAEGAAKPESDFAFEMTTFEVKKLAHWIKASDEILEDYPALRSYIDSQLIDGLRDVEDAQILKGDGTGNNLLGLYTQAQVFARAEVGDTLLDTMLRAQTQLRLVNRRATGIALNPVDWETIVLAKGTDAHYIWANVQAGNGQQIWAIPVRDTTKLEEGEWLVGDFRRGAQLFDRRQAAITVATQNQDDFIKNLVTILGEERLALVTYDALSFVKNAPAV